MDKSIPAGRLYPEGHKLYDEAMAVREKFSCSACGSQYPHWFGRCPACNEWNTATQIETPGSIIQTSPVVSLRNSPQESEAVILSGIDEMDRILGGGIMPGTTVLLGGDPGIGKSTLMLQMAAKLAHQGTIVYVSGEETARRIRGRAERLNIHDADIQIICDTSMDAVIASLSSLKPTIVIIDSIQTMKIEEHSSIPGSVVQVRSCASKLIAFARQHMATIFLVTHVTKEGDFAGPKLLEHLVDTVLLFEHSGNELRFIRATKNRFGPTDEVGLFVIGKNGLTPVNDPSQFFLIERKKNRLPPGVITTPVYEGSRVFLIEIQALTVPASGPASRVYSEKIDARRVARIAAVLEKHIRLKLSDQDIYVNVAGGMTIRDGGVDVPLALALYSARMERPIPANVSAVGEVSLAAEILPIPFIRQRIRATADMGFHHSMAPPISDDNLPDCYEPVQEISEALELVFSPHRGEQHRNSHKGTDAASQ